MPGDDFQNSPFMPANRCFNSGGDVCGHGIWKIWLPFIVRATILIVPCATVWTSGQLPDARLVSSRLWVRSWSAGKNTRS